MAMMNFHRVACCLLVLALASCSEERLDCPGIAQSCGDECLPMQAYPFSPGRECVTYVAEIVGCTSEEVGTDDAPCVKRHVDGAMFIATSGSAFRSSEGWSECSPEEQAALRDQPCNEGEGTK